MFIKHTASLQVKGQCIRETCSLRHHFITLSEFMGWISFNDMELWVLSEGIKLIYCAPWLKCDRSFGKVRRSFRAAFIRRVKWQKITERKKEGAYGYGHLWGSKVRGDTIWSCKPYIILYRKYKDKFDSEVIWNGYLKQSGWAALGLTGRFICRQVFKVASFDDLHRESSCSGVVHKAQQDLWSWSLTCRREWRGRLAARHVW